MIQKIEKTASILKRKSKGNVYLFGASVTGQKVYKRIEESGCQDTVAAFVDNNTELWKNKLFGKKIIGMAELAKSINQNDIILITSNKYIEIGKELDTMGLTEHLKCDDTFIDYCINYDKNKNGKLQPWEKALRWIFDNTLENGGFRATSAHEAAYPEVTGYVIPTLVTYGYYEEAKAAVKWLLTLQNDNGGFNGIKGTADENKEFVFDSGQILRGFLALKDDKNLKSVLEKAIDKVCEYLCDQMIDNGKNGYKIQYAVDEKFIAEPILIYTLAPLKEAAEYRKRNDWKIAADNCLKYYITHKDFLSKKTLTHFLAYQIEALIELEQQKYIADCMNYFEIMYKERGYIPGVEGAEWTCSTGNAQIAICCYLTGRNELANKLVEDLEKLQMNTGGFFGSYGKNPEYFPNAEILWANKYFLDANRLRIQEWFNDNVQIFPVDVDEKQAEFEKVAENIQNGMSIAEIGCGKGRFLKLLNEKFENLSLTGIDISEKMIECLPAFVTGAVGTLEHIPLADNKYDVSLCIEAIEHSINIPVFIKELVRIVKPGGKVIIIDKNKKHWGRLQCPSWERWMDSEAMVAELKKHCESVSCENVDLYRQDGDDMFLAWIGVKGK